MKRAYKDMKSAMANGRSFSDLYNTTRADARTWLHSHPEPASGRKIYRQMMRRSRQMRNAANDPITAYLEIYGIETMDNGTGPTPSEFIKWCKNGSN